MGATKLRDQDESIVGSFEMEEGIRNLGVRDQAKFEWTSSS